MAGAEIGGFPLHVAPFQYGLQVKANKTMLEWSGNGEQLLLYCCSNALPRARPDMDLEFKGEILFPGEDMLRQWAEECAWGTKNGHSPTQCVMVQRSAPASCRARLLSFPGFPTYWRPGRLGLCKRLLVPGHGCQERCGILAGSAYPPGLRTAGRHLLLIQSARAPIRSEEMDKIRFGGRRKIQADQRPGEITPGSTQVASRTHARCNLSLLPRFAT